MKLVRIMLPCATTLTVGGLGMLAIPPAQVPLLPPPPASTTRVPAPPPASRPLTLLPPSASRPLVLPVPARPSAPPPPAQGRTFVVPSPRGGFSMINIPRCYLAFGMQSRGGRTEFTDRAGRVLALPSQCRTLLSARTLPAPR